MTVGRRYNDFRSLHEALIHRYPYRIIPSLPPKKFAGNMIAVLYPLEETCYRVVVFDQDCVFVLIL